MKKFIKIFLIVILTTKNALAIPTSSNNTPKIILPAVQVAKSDFEARLESNSKTEISFSDFYLSTHPTSENVSELLKLFEQAQILYFSQSESQAAELFHKILSMLEVDDWRDLHRKVFFTAFLRLAELEPNREAEFLERAVQFAPEVNANSLEAPKKFLNKITQLKNNKKNLEWNVAGFKKDFKVIIANGRIIDLNKTNKIILPSGKFRITFLSDYYKPQVFNVSSQQVPFITPTRVAFVTGHCSKPSIANDGDISSSYEIDFGKNCKSDKLTIAHDLVPTYNKLPEGQSIYESLEKPFYKKTWFIVTATAVAAGIVLYATQKHKREGSSGAETSREVIP